MEDILLPSVIFAAILLASTLLRWGVKSRQEAAHEELSRRLGVLHGDPGLLREPRASGPALLAPLLGALDRMLEQAGLLTSAPRLLALIALLALAGVSGGILLLRGPLAIAGLLLGALPVLYLRRLARRRDRELTLQLPEALDLINRALQAGHAFTDSLRISAEELPYPVGLEFAQVSEEHRLGRELRECMERMIRRNPRNFDLRLFASAVLMQRETGGRLVEMLDNIARTIRERLVFEDKVDAITAEVRFSAVILALLPFLVGALLLILQPGYLAPMLHAPLGRSLLAGAGLLMLAGGGVMWAIARVEA